MAGADLKARMVAEARRLGFDPVRVTSPTLPPVAGTRLREFLDAGAHGTMGWLARDPERRASPDALWHEARSALVLGTSYAPESDPLAATGQPLSGAVSVYARGRDYHDVIKSRLKALGRWLARETGAELKVFVDTAPILEKPLAERAGVGWQGKHTNLVSRTHGSWLFLAEILTTLELEPDAPEADHCGTCRRCLDVCPTDAFPAPYRLDARRCISYLTIEHAGPIPEEFRAAIGNRIYGCDDCLAVCPWNKFAEAAHDLGLAPRPDLAAPSLAMLADLDDAAFRRFFSGSPIKRIGRDRFVRNVLIAIGNSGDRALLPAAAARTEDSSDVVRETARWAVGRLGAPDQPRSTVS